MEAYLHRPPAGVASGGEANDAELGAPPRKHDGKAREAARSYPPTGPARLRRIASRGYLSSGGGVAPFVSEVACELLEAERAVLDAAPQRGGALGPAPRADLDF